MADNLERLYTPVDATPTNLETARFWVQNELRKISNAFLRADEKYANGGTGPAPSDPRDTVAFVQNASTIFGFGIASVDAITQGYRITFNNAASSRYAQSVQVVPGGTNSSDRYVCGVHIQSTTQCEVFSYLVNVDGTLLPTSRLFLSVERTLL